jgi:predicted GNAT family acetyltransferase
MELISFSTPDEFLRRTRATLERDEPRNHLILGIALTLQRGSPAYQRRPYLALVGHAGEPVLIALMTPPFNLVLAGDAGTAEPAAQLLVEDLVAGGWPVPGVLAPVPLADALASAWHRRTGEPVRVGMDQRAYALRRVRPVAPSPGRLRPAAPPDLLLAAAWIESFHREFQIERSSIDAREMAQNRIQDRTLYLWEHGRPVSMAASSRPTAHGVSVSLVYTPPAERGRGYATSCVAALSRRLLAAGSDWVSLFTDLSNPTSNAIYQRIGYRPVADFRDYHFGD